MIKKGLKVKVLTGKDKKKEGEIIEIDRKKQAMKKCKENHREELSTIKNQIEEQVKCIYKSSKRK